jgi:hypothetical protein
LTLTINERFATISDRVAQFEARIETPFDQFEGPSTRLSAVSRSA